MRILERVVSIKLFVSQHGLADGVRRRAASELDRNLGRLGDVRVDQG